MLKALFLALCLSGYTTAPGLAQTVTSDANITRRATIVKPSPVTQETDVANTSAIPTLRVGIKPIAPFVFLPEGQPPYGYSIELWTQVADELGVDFKFVPYQSVGDLLTAVRTEQVDVAIAAISMTAERETNGLDFSHAFFNSGLQLMVVEQKAGGFTRLVGYLTNWNVIRPILMVALSSTLTGVLIWSLEHRHNPGFDQDPLRGIGQGIWFALVTLGTFGYGDVTPSRFAGRFVTCLWMGVSFFILADFISSMTLERLKSQITGLEDLHGQAIGVVEETTAERFMVTQPVNITRFKTFEDAKTALIAGEIAGLVQDYPTVQYEASRNPSLLLVGNKLTHEDYGIALPAGANHLREQIDRTLLELQAEGTFQLLGQKWLKEAQSSQ